MKIVFMGTPDYSVKTLTALIEAGHEITGVFAQPDKPVGRKRILTPPPVKICAENNGIPVFQPETLRNGEALKIIEELSPELIVVVAYGKILPKEILSSAKYGCVNGHASLLPKYRGASPIQWAIVCGETETGVTTMYMDEGMDTGDIIETERVTIGEDETADELFERLAVVSADLMVKTVAKIENGTATRTPQPSEGVSYAPILKKEMALMDFTKTAKQLSCEVRGLYSWPCAYFVYDLKRIKVTKAKALSVKTEKPCGTVIVSDSRLLIACGDKSVLELIEIQPEGSRIMPVSVFQNGRKIPEGTVLQKV